MRPRVRRALRRLLWVLVHGGARALALAGGWLIQRAVAIELDAERRVDLSRPARDDGWAPLPEPALAPSVVPPSPGPAYHASARETKWADWTEAHGVGLFVILPDRVAVAIRNAGHS